MNAGREQTMDTISIDTKHELPPGWNVDPGKLGTAAGQVKSALLDLASPVYLAEAHGQLGAANALVPFPGAPVLAFAGALLAEDLGDPAFKAAHGVKYAYHGGAMANAIASENLVIALGKQGFLCSFGCAGLVPDRVEEGIRRIQAELPDGPYACNLIHAPAEEALERGAVERFLKLGVHTVEASAYLGLTEHIVLYRVAGLSRKSDGSVTIGNKVIAKISRTETARRFMEPAPPKIVARLLEQGRITAEQAQLSTLVPMADDITAEADSGGHTDNRPFLTLIPSIMALRDEIMSERNYAIPLRVGGGGGIGTPEAALAAFTMGVAYVVLGSVNQACIESGASEHTRKLLAEAEMADVTMAPAADMFEMGVRLQVLKRGTMFPMRAQKLYDLYREYDSIEAIPKPERLKIEEQIFRASLDDIWNSTIGFFRQRDPEMLERAMSSPKRKMALIFRWYLGLSSRWSNSGEKGRELDYQIWAGPSLGAFNAWVKGSYLEAFDARSAPDVALQILRGAAYLQRVQLLRLQGVNLTLEQRTYRLAR
jgi:PfaD family protein